MSNINYDTRRVRQLGENLIKLSNDYISLINALNTRLQQMPNGTGEWMGPSAERFVNLVYGEMRDYVALGNTISSYGNSLLIAAENVEKTFVNR